MRTKTLWVRPEYLASILNGEKTIEVRVAYSNIARLQAGDRLLLNDRYPFIIQAVHRYQDFEQLLANESPQAIAPGLARDDLLLALRALYPPDKELLGAVALHIRQQR